MPTLIALMEMPLTRRLVPLVLAVLVAGVTVELIRRRKLLEQYAVFWVVASAALLVLAVVPDIVLRLQKVLQTNYLSIVVVMGFGLMSLAVMHFAVIATRYATQLRQLAQRQALLELELRKHRDASHSESQPPARTEP